jgi:23S rRNA pseudouridine2605 synthase
MRINKFIAQASGLSRRKADSAIQQGRVTLNDQLATQGSMVSDTDRVALDGHKLALPGKLKTIMLNKPAAYVVSREGQGSKTIYELLPSELQELKPVGRLDKDSSGLLLLTNDGQLANELTHPKYQKTKIYEISLATPLQPLHQQLISDKGIALEDGISQFQLERLRENNAAQWRVIMHEGRNRQIRRTFAALGYTLTKLHRVQFGPHTLPANLKPGAYIPVSIDEHEV